MSSQPFLPLMPKRALEFAEKITGGICNFVLGTEHHPFSGGECRIFVVENQRQEKIAVRIEHRVTELTHVKVEREVQLLEDIKRERISHLPVLLGCCFDEMPPLIATSWADGKELKWTDFEPATETRRTIIQTIAKITLDLLRINDTGECPTRFYDFMVNNNNRTVSSTMDN
jgi:hypothetical protein